MTAENSSTDNKDSSESSKVTREKEAIKKLQDELNETGEVTKLKTQRAGLEAKKNTAKLSLADLRFIVTEEINGKKFKFPKFSYVDDENGKLELRCLLDGRSKKSFLDQDGMNETNWLSKIPPEKNTFSQINGTGGPSSELFKLLQEKGFIQEIADATEANAA